MSWVKEKENQQERERVPTETTKHKPNHKGLKDIFEMMLLFTQPWLCRALEPPD